MEKYIEKYDTFDKSIIYDFQITYGGIGDCIKFFIVLLNDCIENNIRLYYKINNSPVEKYIKLKYDKMYIKDEDIHKLKSYEIITPFSLYQFYYKTYDMNENDRKLIKYFNLSDIYYFTDDVINNYIKLFPNDINNYISLHVRIGDNFLGVDMKYVMNKESICAYSNEAIHDFIIENKDKKIFFCCDNKIYKQNLLNQYNNLFSINTDIGHTSFIITSEKEVLDAITEFYSLTKSDKIYMSVNSGFSKIAALFNNIDFIKL